MGIISFKDAIDPTKPPWFGIITLSCIEHMRREKNAHLLNAESGDTAIKQIFD